MPLSFDELWGPMESNEILAKKLESLSEENARLTRQMEEMRALLKEYEWTWGACGGRCLSCGHYADEKHTPDCELARLIK